MVKNMSILQGVLALYKKIIHLSTVASFKNVGLWKKGFLGRFWPVRRIGFESSALFLGAWL